MSIVHRLRFEFIQKENGAMELLDYRPFQASLLPTLLYMSATMIVELKDLAEDNAYKILAREVIQRFSEIRKT